MKALTIKGKAVVLDGWGNDGKLYGSVPGEMTRTWWNADGSHNTYRDLDLSPDTLRICQEWSGR